MLRNEIMSHMRLSDTVEVESRMVAGFHIFEITQDEGDGEKHSVTLVSDEADGLAQFIEEEL